MEWVGGMDWINLYQHMHKCRGIGYMDVVEIVLPYGNATKIFLPIFYFKKIFNPS
jgi:hypothetical protein